MYKSQKKKFFDLNHVVNQFISSARGEEILQTHSICW